MEEKDCRNCKYATLLKGKFEGWVKCKEYIGSFEMIHSPCFAAVMCTKYKPK